MIVSRSFVRFSVLWMCVRVNCNSADICNYTTHTHTHAHTHTHTHTQMPQWRWRVPKFNPRFTLYPTQHLLYAECIHHFGKKQTLQDGKGKNETKEMWKMGEDSKRDTYDNRRTEVCIL